MYSTRGEKGFHRVLNTPGGGGGGGGGEGKGKRLGLSVAQTSNIPLHFSFLTWNFPHYDCDKGDAKNFQEHKAIRFLIHFIVYCQSYVHKDGEKSMHRADVVEHPCVSKKDADPKHEKVEPPHHL